MDLISAGVLQSGSLGVPGYILNTFFPGALAQFRKHPRLVKLFSFVVAFWALWPYLQERLRSGWRYISSYFMSSVTIESNDIAFESLQQWLSSRKIFKDTTSFRAFSVFENNGQTTVQQVKTPSVRSRSRNSWDYHSNQITRTDSSNSLHKFDYEPRGGLQFFFYGGNVVFVEKNLDHPTSGRIILSCFGRTAAPVRDILSETSGLYARCGSLVTVIRRAIGGSWSQVTTKSQRSIESVSIDSEQKVGLLADIDEYVASKTASWYGARGIPYRRGYLFHGPPGTGKSSLAMALAARYKRDIYVIPLLDPNIYDANLMALLNQVPNHAVVLFEDVDSAGLSREQKDPIVPPPSIFLQSQPGSFGRRAPSTQVTLSGLLNAIDGVQSPEGHILILTTNKIEELDQALIRSGRISVRVAFGLANPAQSREIFLRMMQEDVDGTLDKSGTEKATGEAEAAETTDTTEAKVSERLEQQASEFAANVPDNVFSPADLQDYLLTHKGEPGRAIEKLEEWKCRKRSELEEAKKNEAKKTEANRNEANKNESLKNEASKNELRKSKPADPKPENSL